MTRAQILEAAKSCVCGNEAYNMPEYSFGAIATFWNDYLFAAGISDLRGAYIKSSDVAAMLILSEVAKKATGKAGECNWSDIAGCAARGGEVEGVEAYEN